MICNLVYNCTKYYIAYNLISKSMWFNPGFLFATRRQRHFPPPTQRVWQGASNYFLKKLLASRLTNVYQRYFFCKPYACMLDVVHMYIVCMSYDGRCTSYDICCMSYAVRHMFTSHTIHHTSFITRRTSYIVCQTPYIVCRTLYTVQHTLYSCALYSINPALGHVLQHLWHITSQFWFI